MPTHATDATSIYAVFALRKRGIATQPGGRRVTSNIKVSRKNACTSFAQKPWRSKGSHSMLESTHVRPESLTMLKCRFNNLETSHFRCPILPNLCSRPRRVMPGLRLHGEEEISHSFESGVAQPSVHACANTMRMTDFAKLDSARALQMGGGK